MEKQKRKFKGKTFRFIKVLEFLRMERGRQVYLCEDVFGDKFTLSSKKFYTNNFGRGLYTESSRRKRARLHKLYHCMLGRCYNPKSGSYSRYGGRGIEVCKEWLVEDGFYSFVYWAVSSGWTEGLVIDRINPEKGYSPENCRFLSKTESARCRRGVYLSKNTADQIRFDFKQSSKGVTLFCREVAERLGVSEATIQSVVYEHNWVN